MYKNKIYVYRTKPFEKFIEDQNIKFFRPKNIDLVAGKEGWWIEIKLPSDKTDELGGPNLQNDMVEYKSKEDRDILEEPYSFDEKK